MIKTAIIIPARLASSRLPNKPLADICGKSMIVRVLEQALKSGIGDVFVAAGDKQIADEITAHGGTAILTDPELPSGTDRIYQAAQTLKNSYDIIVNVQGDLPTLDPSLITTAVNLLKDSQVDIATLASTIVNEAEKTDSNTVKAIIAQSGRALYFTRSTAPYGAGKLYHHIGLYAYTSDALKKFISLPPSPLEKREQLEQLRALENDMYIKVAIVDTIPIGVDSKEDLEYVRELIKQQNG